MVAPSVKRRRLLHLRKLAQDAASAAEAAQEALLEVAAAAERKVREVAQRKATAQKAAQEAAKAKADAAKVSSARRVKKEEE